LPFVEPWQRVDSGPLGGSATILGAGAAGADSLRDSFPLDVWILLALVAGVGVGMLRLALGLGRLNRYRQTALRIASLPEALHEAQALVGVGSTFYYSDRVKSPVTFGWLHPAIIFPRRFERLDENEQRAIACHELLHVARRDWPMNLLEELILTVFWFHPAVWWVMRNIRLAREQVVDGRVVELTGARKPYLRALLEIARTPRATMLPAPLFLVESQLARRVASLVKEVRMSKPRLVGSLAIALAVLVAAGWGAVKTFRLVAPAQLPAQQMVGYMYSSPPGSDVPSIFMFYMVKEDDRVAFSGPRPIGGVHVEGPVPISMRRPPYTPQAKKDRVQGAIVAAVDVDASGNVTGVKLNTVSLSRDLRDGLDEGVIATLGTWKFKPAMKKGKPVPAKITVQVNFSLS
jgi:TonB family protein